MSEYTPPPWTIESNCILGPGGRICTMDSAIAYRDNIEANARLIAAAPELLIACKLALSSCDPYSATTRYMELAIARAEGKK